MPTTTALLRTITAGPKMNIREIEHSLESMDHSLSESYPFDLLLAYGITKTTIRRLQSEGKGSYNKAAVPGDLLWRKKLFYRAVEEDDIDLLDHAVELASDDKIAKQSPRFIVVRDANSMAAIDTKTNDTLNVPVVELPAHAAFFMPWAGVEKTVIETSHYADIKAAERMAKLYDEVAKHPANDTESEAAIHALNEFFTRLLFCYFAEDTGVFENRLFSNTLASVTQESGADVAEFLDDLFEVLNTKPEDRNCAAHFREFGYVNGKLFEQESAAPQFSSNARGILIELAALDWSQINPDIFGSMMQAVVHPSQREGLGMHYTSVENIKKVLRPLFLDELHEEFEAAQDSKGKLEKLHKRISAIKVFDPACGSGNFLVIAYKELRKLEHQIMQRMIELSGGKARLFQDSEIHLDNFYGIEIDDFACEVATLSLYLAKHQMNVEFSELFGILPSLIPLRENGRIVNANATRVDWSAVCPSASEDEVVVCGNPPYLGSRNQNSAQKDDLRQLHPRYKSLDYVCAWFILGARFAEQSTSARIGFVATNSITQGDHVALLWPSVFENGVEIAFGVQSFRWSNEAKRNAGVTCVIVGLRVNPPNLKPLYTATGVKNVANISPYLTASSNMIVARRKSPISADIPSMSYGCLLNDKGAFMLDRAEVEELVNEFPECSKFIMRFVGGQELLKGRSRWCLHIADDDLEDALRSPLIRERLERVAAHRSSSTEPSTQKLATHPNRYYFDCYRPTTCLVVPDTSSENRDYVPMGFEGEGTVISNANAIYDADPWVFGLIQSRMHMVWVRAVAGRLKTDLRYSAVLVYNTFPVPELSDDDKSTLTKAANRVLGTREMFSESTLAELYDPDKMPPPLREAHHTLDKVVDDLYNPKGFDSDEQRLEMLFEMYAEMTTAKELQPANA